MRAHENNKNIRILFFYIIVLFIGACSVFINSNQAFAEEYFYDENDRVIKVIHDDGSSTEYTYDENGNIINIADFTKEETSNRDSTRDEDSSQTNKNTDNNNTDKNNSDRNNVNISDNSVPPRSEEAEESVNVLSTNTDGESVKTGDSFPVYIILVILIMSAAISSSIIYFSRNKRRN